MPVLERETSPSGDVNSKTSTVNRDRKLALNRDRKRAQVKLQSEHQSPSPISIQIQQQQLPSQSPSLTTSIEPLAPTVLVLRKQVETRRNKSSPDRINIKDHVNNVKEENGAKPNQTETIGQQLNQNPGQNNDVNRVAKVGQYLWKESQKGTVNLQMNRFVKEDTKGQQEMKSPQEKNRSLVITVTTCYICRREFLSYEKLKIHMKEHSETDGLEAKGALVNKDDAMISCGICGKECCKKDIDEHFKTHDIGGDDDTVDNGSNDVDMDDSDLYNTLSKLNAVADADGDDSQQHGESIDTIGDENGDQQCGICGKGFGSEGLAIHMERHNQFAENLNTDKLYTVEQSPFRNAEGNLVSKDGKGVFRKAYQCKKCPYQTDRPSRMKEHVRTCFFTDPQYGCRFCGKVYKIKRNLLSHMKMHGDMDDWSPSGSITGKNFSCPKCYYETGKRSRYQEHLHTCGVIDEMFECEVCSKVFRLRRYLNKHRKIHKTGSHYSCTMCQFKTESGAELGRHIRECNLKNKGRCKFCSMTFGSNLELLGHLESNSCFNAHSQVKEEAIEESSVQETHADNVNIEEMEVNNEEIDMKSGKADSEEDVNQVASNVVNDQEKDTELIDKPNEVSTVGDPMHVDIVLSENEKMAGEKSIEK